MLPPTASAPTNQRHMRLTNAKLLSHRRLCHSVAYQTANGKHVVGREFRIAVLLSHDLAQTRPNGVPIILKNRRPLKILKSVVGLDTVQVVCLNIGPASRRGKPERLQNELMNKPLPPFTALVYQADYDVAVMYDGRYLSRSMSRHATAIPHADSISAHLAVTRNLVPRAPRYSRPSRHHVSSIPPHGGRDT